jgi:hypothetical protein
MPDEEVEPVPEPAEEPAHSPVELPEEDNGTQQGVDPKSELLESWVRG